MLTKQFIFSTRLISLIILLHACSGGSKTIDPYEKLEQPPEIVHQPSTEAPSIEDETLITNGLGEKVQLLGGENAPILTLAMNFENAWQILERVLKHDKIPVTDLNRDQGYYLVNFDADSYPPKTFMESIGQSLFSEAFGLRKYRLNVKQAGTATLITAKDLGAVTTPKDAEEGVEEVVDDTLKGPADSQKRLLATLYKTLHDGFNEHEKP